MKHALLIRFSYPPGDPRVEWRFAWFSDEVLPRLLAQTVQDFEIWMLCLAHDVDRLAALHPRVLAYAGDAPWQALDLQTRHDSDDLVEPGYVERLRAAVATARGKPLLVTFQPWKLDVRRGQRQRYRMQTRYHRRQCSAFTSLYQPSPDGRKFAYGISHIDLWKLCPRVITVPEGFCDAVIHGHNDSTRINRGDRRI